MKNVLPPQFPPLTSSDTSDTPFPPRTGSEPRSSSTHFNILRTGSRLGKLVPERHQDFAGLEHRSADVRGWGWDYHRQQDQLILCDHHLNEKNNNPTIQRRRRRKFQSVRREIEAGAEKEARRDVMTWLCGGSCKIHKVSQPQPSPSNEPELAPSSHWFKGCTGGVLFFPSRYPCIPGVGEAVERLQSGNSHADLLTSFCAKIYLEI